MTIPTTPSSNNATASAAPREAHQGAVVVNPTDKTTSIQEQENMQTKTTSTLADTFGDPIYVYSRAQAIKDGILVDVSASASEVGFRSPVAMTRAAWLDCVAWSDEDSRRQTYQDEAGRLWDVLWMSAQAARRGQSERLAFQLYCIPRGARETRPRLTTLHLAIGPGDNGEPVLTILLPDED